jgi:hypothetical protein
MYDGRVLAWTEKAPGVWAASVAGNPWDVVCGRVVVAASAAQCVRLLASDAKRRDYDRMFRGAVEHRRIECGAVAPPCHLKTLRYAGAWPVADRRFHVLSGWRPHQFGELNAEFGAVVGSKSVVPCSIEALALAEYSGSLVPGRLFVAGFAIRPLATSAGRQCELTMVSHVDFKGTLPPSVINFVQANIMPEMLEQIQKLAPLEPTENGEFERALARTRERANTHVPAG